MDSSIVSFPGCHHVRVVVLATTLSIGTAITLYTGLLYSSIRFHDRFIFLHHLGPAFLVRLSRGRTPCIYRHDRFSGYKCRYVLNVGSSLNSEYVHHPDNPCARAFICLVICRFTNRDRDSHSSEFGDGLFCQTAAFVSPKFHAHGEFVQVVFPSLVR